MNDFLRRVRRLQDRLSTRKHRLVILTYADGSKREMDWMSAFMEISGGGAAVVAVKYPDPTGESLLAAMLPGIENGDNLWKGIDDEP